jgi:hypothetical protein
MTAFKQALDTVLDHIIRDLDMEAVPIDPERDFYWNLSEKDLYDTTKRNPTLDVGRIVDDWEFFSKTPEDREQTIAYMLIHAAPLLRYLAETVKK